MRSWVVALSVLAACGNVTTEGGGARNEDDASPSSSDGSSGGVDAASPPSPDGSAGEAPPRCRPDAPFEKGVNLTILNTPFLEDGGFLTPDELTIYFSSTRDDGVDNHDIWFATRTSTDDEFGEPALLPGVNTASVERRPSLSSDGLVLMAADFAVDFDIARSIRQDTATDFEPIELVSVLNIGVRDEAPYLLPSGRIYYSTDFSDSPPPDAGARPRGIWVSQLVGNDLEDPQPIEGVDVGLDGPDDAFPVLSTDERTLFFNSSREDGNSDIWIARRGSVEEGFGPADKVTELSEVNTPQDELPSWISPDGCVLYYVSEIIGTDNRDLYRATRGK